MPQYGLIIIPRLLSWPMWRSWLLSPYAPCNPATSTVTTTVFTSTILPTSTHTIITLENAHQRRERILRQAEELTEKICRRHQEKKAREAARLMEEEKKHKYPGLLGFWSTVYSLLCIRYLHVWLYKSFRISIMFKHSTPGCRIETKEGSTNPRSWRRDG